MVNKNKFTEVLRIMKRINKPRIRASLATWRRKLGLNGPPRTVTLMRFPPGTAASWGRARSPKRKSPNMRK